MAMQVFQMCLSHGLDRRLNTSAPVVENVGEMLKHSIKINELVPRDGYEDSYVLVSAAKAQKGDTYIATFIVETATNEVDSVDILYAANAKKNRLHCCQRAQETLSHLPILRLL